MRIVGIDGSGKAKQLRSIVPAEWTWNRAATPTGDRLQRSKGRVGKSVSPADSLASVALSVKCTLAPRHPSVLPGALETGVP
jgi:hypothetical protein